MPHVAVYGQKSIGSLGFENNSNYQKTYGEYIIMPEPAALWGITQLVSNKRLSSTQNVILSQARSALIAVIARIDKLYALVESSPIHNVFIHEEIPPTITDLCYQAGLVSTILFNESQRGRKESETAFLLRLQRVKYVEYLCATHSFEIFLLKNRDIRNAMTHTDEHLADALTKTENIGWSIDMAIRSVSEFVAPDGIQVKYCRTYVKNDDKIIHINTELPILPLRVECEKLLKIIFNCDLKLKV